MPPTSGTTSLPLDAPLPRKNRAFIVLVALLQGGPLSLAALGQQHGVWPFTELGARICWYTLIMTIPGVALLRAQDLRIGHCFSTWPRVRWCSRPWAVGLHGRPQARRP